MSMLGVLVSVKGTVDQMVADAYVRIDEQVPAEQRWHEEQIQKRGYE